MTAATTAIASPYRYDIADRADAIDSACWETVRSVTDHPFLKLGFLRASETSFAGMARFWYATIRDDQGAPIAIAGFSRFLVDVTLFAGPKVKAFVTRVRQSYPLFLNFSVIFGGTPVSTCEGQLALLDGIDDARLAATLNRIGEELATQTRARFICFKEFKPSTTAHLSGLEQHGYLQTLGLIGWALDTPYESFESFLAGCGKKLRGNIRYNFRKLDEAGFTCETRRGGQGVAELFTNDVHRLYLNVLDRSSSRLETLPAEFFRQLAIQLPDASVFTFIRRGDQITAFTCGILSRGVFDLIFCGLDYAVNDEHPLYSNVVYRLMSSVMGPDVQLVRLGAHADEFKRRMGCHKVPLMIFLKATGPFFKLFLRLFGKQLLPKEETPSVAVSEEET